MRPRALALAFLLLAAAPVLTAAPAGAQRLPGYDPDVTGTVEGWPRGYPDDPPRTGPQLCQRWCEADHVPCDPPHFKIADGRCRPWGGGRR
ncbi:hypothetical protein OPKNFCMD_3480 [Methylobacterium crusticola]|uniref:Apple domain-containing protein n=1 Tax=Methylobacterium crusticola TaxID=1697972 RepID=A0ABQ4R0U1_9HYPH|nr:hypothetical protein [Methylobacterium crusticola]GJD50735.1 hypothetical protein OPKNFCMD_3480 [Methylobacterium crusticola]